MSRNWAIAIIIFVVAALAIIGTYYLSQRRIVNLPEPSPTSAPVEGFPAIQSSLPSTQPESGTDTLDTGSVPLIIIEPYDQTEISSPVKISGFLNVTENPTVLNIKDASGKILGTGLADSCLDENGCFFETSVSFDKPQTATGTVEALKSDTNDQIGKVSIKFQ